MEPVTLEELLVRIESNRSDDDPMSWVGDLEELVLAMREVMTDEQWGAALQTARGRAVLELIL